ncbi:MAG TPA: PepSY domain-containing protein [Mariprofundaceae bacterium]|nr:PepSY domain-containing protein [Mariprofundaceae bacterium]
MNRAYRFRALATGVLTVLVLTGSIVSPVPAAEGNDDQDVVRELRQQGKILPLSTIVERLTAKYPGRILQAELENEKGKRIYEIQMILKGGIVRTFHVDAHTGEILSTTRKEDR